MSSEFTVALFAAAREAIQQPEIKLHCDEPCNIGDIRKLIEQEYPNLHAALLNCRFAVNLEFVHDSETVSSEDAIAIIPPVGGG